MKRIAILGSTGSIGTSALAVVDAHPDKLKVVALAAGGNAAKMAEQIQRYRPAIAAMASEDARAAVLSAIEGAAIPVEVGPEGLTSIATHASVDVLLCASTGVAALGAVLAAIAAGKTIALANKEVLVMAGALVMGAAKAAGTPVLPVDSEHSAIQQCLQGRARGEIERIVLTASGGPFLGKRRTELQRVTAADALDHPTWRMGRKITVDSATLMNKGLEVIEARWLFDVPPSRLGVLVHPQSIVHALVELRDGSVITHMGPTDMRGPIQYAFSYPERWDASVPTLDLVRTGPLEFREPAWDDFPCLGLAYRALEDEWRLPIVLNAANEVAVAAFLDGALSFCGISELVGAALDAAPVREIGGLPDVLALDAWTRTWATEAVQSMR